MELMPEFKLHRPETVAEAVALNGGSETARYLAGGTDMVVNIRRGIETPETLVDLNAVTEMTEIREDADGLHIGAAVKLQELGRHESVQRDYAAVAEAAVIGVLAGLTKSKDFIDQAITIIILLITGLFPWIDCTNAFP